MLCPTSEDDQGACFLRGRRSRIFSEHDADGADKSHLSDSGSDGGLAYLPPKVTRIKNA
jgi:hypothetical protein